LHINKTWKHNQQRAKWFEI